jgi:hypothetical protein
MEKAARNKGEHLQIPKPKAFSSFFLGRRSTWGNSVLAKALTEMQIYAKIFEVKHRTRIY